MKTVATYSMPSETHVPLSRLQSAGIDARLRDDSTLNLNWLWSQALGGVRLEVPDEDADAARAILHLPASEEGLMHCPHCGSTDLAVRPLPPAAALFAFMSLPIPCPLIRVDCRACGQTHDRPRAGDGPAR